MRRLVGLAVLALAIAACQAEPSTMRTVHLQNQTDIPVAVHVNGTWIGTYPAGAVTELPIPAQEGEYRIEARSPSGAALLTLLGTAAMVDAAEANEQVFDAWADVPCGRIAMSVGAIPLVRPAPGPATGPCPYGVRRWRPAQLACAATRRAPG